MKLLLLIYFSLSFCFAFVSLAVSLKFLEDWEAKDLPLLYAAISAPWSAKFLLASLVDRIPIHRSRFVCGGFLLGGLSWALAPISPAFLILASGMVCIADCATDAIMVAVSKENDRIQRLSIAFRSGGELVGTLLGGLVYTWGYTLTMHSVSLCLIPVGILSLDLPDTKPSCSYPKWSWNLLRLQFIGFCISAIPTPSTYILMSWSAGGMTSITIALASVASQGGSLLGLWAGKRTRRDVSTWTSLVCRMVLSLSAWGISLNPMLFSVMQNALGGFAGAFFLAPFIELTTQLVPVDGNEAFTYSAVMAALNLGGIASSALESVLMKVAKVETAEDDPIPLLSVCLVASLLAFPLGHRFQSISTLDNQGNGREVRAEM